MKRNTIIIGSVLLIVLFLIQWSLQYPYKHTIGYIGGIIGGVSGIPHVIRVWQKKVTIKASSWAVWSLCGIAQIITFVGDSNAFWPLIGNAFFPLVNLTYCLYYWKEYKGKLDGWEWACMILGLASMGMYIFVHFVPIMSNEYSNYIAIFADGFALVPTLFFVWKNPMQERPLPWFLFTMGMVFASIAITDGRLASYALPVYMAIGSSLVWLPLVIHRIKYNKSEWYWYCPGVLTPGFFWFNQKTPYKTEEYSV